MARKKAAPAKKPEPSQKKMSQQRVRNISRSAVKHAVLDSAFLTPTMVSTDPGNGYEEFWRVGENGSIESYSMPHGRVPVTGDMLDRSILVRQNEIEWFQWYGQAAFDKRGNQIEEPMRYGYGEGVWNLARRAPEQHRNDADRYAGDQQMSKIVLGIAKLGVPNGSEVTVIIPVPPTLLQQDASLADRIRKVIHAGEDHLGESRWSILLKGEKDWRTYFLTRVAVIPEGLGAAFAYRFNINGQPVPLNYYSERVDDMAGTVRIHDGGFGTYDVLEFHNGVLSPEGLRTATDSNGGIQAHIARPVLDEMRKITGVMSLTDMHVDAWLRHWARNGYTEEASIQLVGDDEVVMHNMFSRLCNDYAAWVAAEKIGPDWQRGINSIGIAGGAWSFIENYIAEKYPQRKIMRPALYEHTKWCPTYSLNGYGALVYLATLLANKK